MPNDFDDETPTKVYTRPTTWGRFRRATLDWVASRNVQFGGRRYVASPE